jgi:hypothetical protein
MLECEGILDPLYLVVAADCDHIEATGEQGRVPLQVMARGRSDSPLFVPIDRVGGCAESA